MLNCCYITGTYNNSYLYKRFILYNPSSITRTTFNEFLRISIKNAVPNFSRFVSRQCLPIIKCGCAVTARRLRGFSWVRKMNKKTRTIQCLSLVMSLMDYLRKQIPKPIQENICWRLRVGFSLTSVLCLVIALRQF